MKRKFYQRATIILAAVLIAFGGTGAALSQARMAQAQPSARAVEAQAQEPLQQRPAR